MSSGGEELTKVGCGLMSVGCLLTIGVPIALLLLAMLVALIGG